MKPVVTSATVPSARAAEKKQLLAGDVQIERQVVANRVGSNSRGAAQNRQNQQNYQNN